MLIGLALNVTLTERSITVKRAGGKRVSLMTSFGSLVPITNMPMYYKKHRELGRGPSRIRDIMHLYSVLSTWFL